MYLATQKNLFLKKIIFYSLLIILISKSCKKDDDSVKIRDVADQALADDIDLKNFLETHFYNYEDFEKSDGSKYIEIIIESIFANEVTISRHAMLSATDNFVSTVPDNEYGTWVFDLRKETMSGRGGRKAVRWLGDGVYKCDFN